MLLGRLFSYVFLIAILSHTISHAEITVTFLAHYAQTKAEFPGVEGDNPLRPKYTKFIKNGYQSQSYLTKDNFPTIAKQLTATLATLLNKFEKSEPPQNITIDADTEVFVWGLLHGSFHSLVRELAFLKQRGIINEELELQHKNQRFIFMGNCIAGSAYGLETLLIIFQLLEKNPGQVIYMQGDLESRQNWMNTDFLEEIKLKLAGQDDADSFINQLSKFFACLPTKLFLSLSQTKKTPQGNTSYLVFDSLSDKPLGNLLQQTPQIEILIQNQNHSVDYLFGQGLIQKPSLYGIPTWCLVSTVNSSVRHIFNYQQDAFYKIDINGNFNQTTVTHFWRDIESSSQDFILDRYNLMSGKKLAEAESYTAEWLELPIICTLDLSQSSKALGLRLLRGIDLKIRQINRQGGVKGKLLRVNFIDDGYTPSNTVKSVEPFVEKNHFNLFLSPLGTPTTDALISYLKDKDYLLLFPYTGSNDLRQPDLKSIYHFRPSYADETKALIKYAKEKKFKQKFAFFYQDDSYGYSSLSAAKESLLNDYKLNPSQLCEGSYMRNNVDVSKAAEAIEKCSPDALFFFSTISPSRALVNRVGVPFLSNITLMGISFLTDNFRSFLSSDKGLKFVMSRIVPSPYQKEIEIISEYRQEFNRWYPGMAYDVDSLEGFINASLLAEILEKAAVPYNNGNISKSIDNLNGKNFKGLVLNFDPETRGFSKEVWIDEFTN